MAVITDIVATILANGSTELTGRIPAGTRATLQDVGTSILDYEPAANEFLSSLLNKIILQDVKANNFANPLQILKKGAQEFGYDIENSFVKPATAAAYDSSGSTLLSTSSPTVITEYFRLNRKDMYTTTIWRDILKQAFSSPAAFEKLINELIKSLTNGDTLDEFILMKNVFSDACLTQKLVTASVTAITDAATAAAFLVALRNVASAFMYPATAWNGYNKFMSSSNVITSCLKENQVIVVRSDILNFVDVNVLASVFNLSKAELQGRLVEVDNFGFCSGIQAVIMDEEAMKVYDNLYDADQPFYNPKGRYWNHYLHHWQTCALSLVCNACAIVNDAVAPAAVVIDEGTCTATDDAPELSTAVTGCMCFFQVRAADDTTVVETARVVAAGNAATFALENALVEGQKIHAWQVDASGNVGTEDTFTVVA